MHSILNHSRLLPQIVAPLAPIIGDGEIPMFKFAQLYVFIALIVASVSTAAASGELTENRMRSGDAVTVTFENCISINWGNIQCGEKYTVLYLPAKNIWQMSGYNIGQKQRIENGYNNVSSDGMHFSAWGYPVTYDKNGVIYFNGIQGGYIKW